VIHTKREDHPTPAGGAHSVVTWDDETGDAEILEYDSAGRVICRRDLEIFPEADRPGPDGAAGEMRTFDPAGQQIEVRSIRGDSREL
jgi:YD repeat-containing protein